VTTLDPRYSDPAATAAPWDETRGVLEKAELFWISTVRADDRPHVTPVVAVWVDEALHFSTGSEEQKYANLRTNPHVVLTTGCNGWDGGLDVVVEGDALRVTDRGASAPRYSLGSQVGWAVALHRSRRLLLQWRLPKPCVQGGAD
jgi:hypothetical protein